MTRSRIADAINSTITAALELLRASHSERVDFRIGRFEKVLADHVRLGGCIHGEQCRTYHEAQTILADAAAVSHG